MARKAVKDLKSGDAVEQPFLVKNRELRTARNGSLYMQLDLSDSTGSISGRVWQASQKLFESFEPDDFVLVKGRVESYRNELQLVVNALRKADESKIELADFMPHTEADVPTMLERMQEIAGSVTDPHLAKLLSLFFEDNEFVEKFCRAPAAVTFHHAYLGGLLEHTLGLTELGLKLLEERRALNRDLLVTGIILHDIGKVDEMSYERAFQYTDQGQLMGHLILGLLRVEEKIKSIPDFPAQMRHVIHHLILSHHGQYEWGSPKLPMCIEAVALHYLDNLDAKLSSFEQIIEGLPESSDWSEWSRAFERRLYRGIEAAASE